MVLFSVIIPARNEEGFLPQVLESLRNQGVECEIVVADGGSADATVSIARQYGCRIVQSGPTGPAAGRNAGARASKGDLLIFLDADALLPTGFLPLAEYQMRKYVRHLDICVCTLWPADGSLGEWVAYGLANVAVKFLARLKPHGAGTALLCRRWLFDEVGGFNENLRFGEDVDFIERASQVGRFGVLRGLHVVTSPRRLRKSGLLRIAYLYTRYFMPVSRPRAIPGYW